MSRFSFGFVATMMATWVLGMAGAASGKPAAQIIPSRTSGAAPLAVHFDATATTCASCGDAFHHVAYEWDFGDPSSGDFPTSQKSRNLATGPLSAHVFEKPGRYTVTLRASDGSGTDIRQVVIDVADPSAVWPGAQTVCFSLTGTFEAGSVCDPSVHPGVRRVSLGASANELNLALGQCGSGSRCLFHRGETYDAAGSLVLSGGSPSMVGAYGSGTPPRFRNSANAPLFVLQPSGRDWRVVDIEVEGPGTTGKTNASIVRAGGTAPAGGLLVLRTRAVRGTFHAGAVFPNNGLPPGPVHSEVFLVENDWQDIGLDVKGRGGNIAFLAIEKLALLGNTWLDTYTPAVGGRGGRTEHVLRCQHCVKGVLSHNIMGDVRPQKATLNLRAAALDTCQGKHAGCMTPTRHHVISDNELRITEGNGGLSLVGGGVPGAIVAGEDIIIERNFFRKGALQTALGNRSGIYLNAEKGSPGSYLDGVTIRNNVFDMTGWTSTRSGVATNGASTLRNLEMFHNTCLGGTDNFTKQIKCTGGANAVTDFNVLYTTTGTSANTAGTGSNDLVVSTNPFTAANPRGPRDVVPTANSPLTNAGSPMAALPGDFFLGVRDAAPDLGAVEAGSGGGGGGGGTAQQAPAAPVLLP